MDTPKNPSSLDPTRAPHPGDYGSDDLETDAGGRRTTTRDEEATRDQAPANGDAGSGGHGVGAEDDSVG